ncbi:MAG: hypothetical protein WC290_03650 [archaeon]|jgi:hypothetical protein|nr:hypothetical protein [archaeon]
MKYAITEHTNIDSIPRDTLEIHLVRPIKWDKLNNLITKCPIRIITISNSCLKRLPTKTQKKIKDKGITIALEKRRGRAIDLPMDKMLQIIELRKDYQTVREIEKITGIPKSTVHYLLKYADRGKIKKGQNVVYLK